MSRATHEPREKAGSVALAVRAPFALGLFPVSLGRRGQGCWEAGEGPFCARSLRGHGPSVRSAGDGLRRRFSAPACPACDAVECATFVSVDSVSVRLRPPPRLRASCLMT